MLALLFPLVFGLAVNVANDHPQNFDDVKASIVKQIEHPVIQPGGPYNQ